MSQNSVVQNPQRMDNTAAVSSTPRWDLSGQQRINGNTNQGLMSQPPSQLMESSSHGFNASLMHRNFQQQMRMGQVCVLAFFKLPNIQSIPLACGGFMILHRNV